MLVVRFARFGRNKQAFFRLVAAESSSPVKKKFIEKLGHYNPHANGGEGEFTFDAEKIKKHIAHGAQLSQTAARLLTKSGLKEAGKFVQQRGTKPKKEVPVEEKPVEVAPEAAVAEAPVEEKKEEVAEEKKED